jgi:hypothetical protein
MCDEHLVRIYHIILEQTSNREQPVYEMYRMSHAYNYVIAIDHDNMTIMTLAAYNLKYPTPREGVSMIRLFYTLDVGLRHLWNLIEIKWYVDMNWEKRSLIKYLDGLDDDVLEVISHLY